MQKKGKELKKRKECRKKERKKEKRKGERDKREKKDGKKRKRERERNKCIFTSSFFRPIKVEKKNTKKTSSIRFADCGIITAMTHFLSLILSFGRVTITAVLFFFPSLSLSPFLSLSLDLFLSFVR